MQADNGTTTTSAPSLTDREMMIVLLMGAGRTTSQIATFLELRPRTVESHRRHIYEKLGVSSQSQAIARAIALGLFQPGQPGTAGGHPERGRRHAGRATLVVLVGPAGKARDQVARLLVRERIPFVAVQKGKGLIHDHWLSWHCGAIVVVAVNPRSHDRVVINSLSAPVVEIHSQDVPGQAAIAGVMARKAGGLITNADVDAGLLPAMEATAQGLLVMSRWCAAALLRITVAQSSAGPRLTTREKDILDSIARGYTIRQTARALGIAMKTVENIQAMLFRKLGAHNRMDALTIAHERGLIAANLLYHA
jgi:DNA-binding NarL/FixJ family response regulator